MKITVLLQLQDDCTLPAYKGSMWHGWLGHALCAVNSEVFKLFYQQQGGEQPRPYAISPGENAKTQWCKDEFIEFGISLFGEAVEQLAPLVHAIQAGQIIGIGPSRTPVKLVMLRNLSPAGSSLDLQAFRLVDYLKSTQQPQAQWALHFVTPLRIKQLGKVLKTADTLTPELVFASARRRLLQLHRHWGEANANALAEMMSAPLPKVRCWHGNLYYEDWQRFSLKQHEFLPFGGLIGVLFCDDAEQGAAEWFQLAELLQIGGKTSFGLGCLKAIPSSC